MTAGANLPRLLFVGAHAPLGGQRSIAASGELAAQFRSRGFEVSTVSHRTSAAARIADIGITMLRRRHDFDVALIDVFSGRAFRWAELAAALCRRLGKPYLLTLHGGSLPSFAAREHTRVRRLLSRASAVTAPSTYLAKALSEQHGVIRVIPNGIDTSRYTHRTRVQPRPALVWLRALHTIYNPLMAVQVVARLRDRFPDITLRMIGPVKDESQHAVRAEIDALGLAHIVTLEGAIPKDAVPAALDVADIFINTTNVDNTPVSVIEAMAAGLCVVSTDAGGLRDLLTDEVDALLVPIGDVEAMAAAVARILGDTSVAERISRNGDVVAKRSAWPEVMAAWTALLDDVTQRAAA